MPIITFGGRSGDAGIIIDCHQDAASPTSNFSGLADVAIRGSTREAEWITAVIQIPSLPLIESNRVQVLSAELSVVVEYGSAEQQTFAMRRLLRDYNAQAANWEQFDSDQPWDVLGGRGVLDRASLVSAELYFAGSETNPPGTEITVSGAQLALDVERMMNGDDPAYGWIFERSGTIADRGWFAFKSSETADGDNFKPFLTVDYTVLSGGGGVRSPIGSAVIDSRIIY